VTDNNGSEPISIGLDDGYAFSGLNRVIVQHGIQQAKLGGHSVHAVSGLPVSALYLNIPSRRPLLDGAVSRLHGRPSMPLQNVPPIDRAPENRFSGLGPDDLNEGEIDSLLALALIDVRVLDHFIVTAEDRISFAEKGLL
jgi:hypothetical protein